LVFLLISLTWVFFRSPSLQTTSEIFSKLFFISRSGIVWFQTSALLFIPVIILGGWLMARFKFSIPALTIDKPYAIPLLLAEYFWIYLFFPVSIDPFIYFQF
jgi:hypothetical protein